MIYIIPQNFHILCLILAVGTRLLVGWCLMALIIVIPHRPYSPDLAPCDFWLFPKVRGSRYETIEKMKEAVTKVIDTLTQKDFHGAFQKLLER